MSNPDTPPARAEIPVPAPPPRRTWPLKWVALAIIIYIAASLIYFLAVG